MFNFTPERNLINFDKYANNHELDCKTEREVLIGGLVVAQDLDLVGYHLSRARRPDLIPHSQAEMLDIDNPEDLHPTRVGNNFISKFKMTGRQGRPIVPEELGQLANIPKVNTVDDFFTLIDDDNYPTVDGYNHSHRPAFLRLLNIFPNLTGRLVMDVSYADDITKPELIARSFVAYKIMSELVSHSDPDVIVNGAVNTEYLVT